MRLAPPKGITGSAIRELLKLPADVVSLAGGLPPEVCIPDDIICQIEDEVKREYLPGKRRQYNKTEGTDFYRETVVFMAKEAGIQTHLEETMVVTGSQQALDLIGKVFLPANKGVVATTTQTYVGAIQAFGSRCPQYVAIASDEYGMIPESLEKMLQTHTVNLIYSVPTHDNPTGTTIPQKRREKIAEILLEKQVFFIEDDPYRRITFEGKAPKAIKSLAPDQVVHLGSFSKILAPDLRLGYVIAPPDILQWLIMAKQGADLNTSFTNQTIGAKFVTGNYLDPHIAQILPIYRDRRDAMAKAIDTYFPKSYSRTNPTGGMFFWVIGPKHVDLTAVLHKAQKEQKVAYVPGEAFHVAEGKGKNTMRLNFGYNEPAIIEQAIQKLGQILPQ